jgi:glycerol-3-phosphate acyltransferase PlsY
MSLALFAAKLLAAYLLGSISGSLVLGRFRGVDIRTQGSGNAGGTNAFRTQGAWFALGTVLIDVGKGALAAGLGFWPPEVAGVSPLAQALACGLACALGHIWPVFFGFRGGKGAAVVVGMMAVCLPVALLPLFGIWLLLLTLSGYVGPSTVAAGASLVPAAWWLAAAPDRPLQVGFALVIAALVAFTHRSNLARLLRGTEHRFERVRVLGRWLGLAPRGGA